MKILAITRMGLLLLGLTACGDGDLLLSFNTDICNTNPCGIVGTYALRSIDGEALPAVVSGLTDPILVEVTAGSVTINDPSPSQPAHGTCSVSSTTRETMTDGTTTMETETEVCTYTFDFHTQALTLTFSPDSTVNGTIVDANGTTITLADDGSVFVYWVSVGLLRST